MSKRNRGRGSSMGKGTRKSRASRKSGKSWLTLPGKWGYFKEEIDTTDKLDLLPYIVKKMKKHPEYEAMQEDVWYRYPYKIHRNVGATRQAMLCPGTIGKPCPICEKMQSIYDDPDINNKKASKFRPSKRSLFIVKVKSGTKKFRKKKFIWDVSDANFFDHVDKEIDRGEEDWNNFACLEGGYTIKVRWDEESFGTGKTAVKYAEAGRIDFTPRKTYKEKILDKNPCLDDMVVPNIPKYKEILEAMKGGKSDKKSKKRNKKKNNRPKLDWDDLVDMEETELLEVIEDAGEDPDDLDYDDEKELRGLVADELGIDIEDDDNDDDDNDDDDNDNDNDNDDNDNDNNDDNDNDNDNDNNDDNDNDDDDNDNDDDNDDEPPETKKQKKLRLKKEKAAKKKKITKKKKAAAKKKKKKDKGNSTKNTKKCPFAYQYGTDWGDHDECNDTDCNQYNKCFKKYDKMQDDE